MKINTDHTFCRLLLKEVMVEVRKRFTEDEIRGAWGYRSTSSDLIEFHGPNKFFWSGQRCCTWLAKYKGWTALIERMDAEKAEAQPEKIPDNPAPIQAQAQTL
ncbi:MAG: hypothetical protein CSYNP_04177 [Syntrophus sp. SKADARSKE-3]|nr:hypothetical protein [Syntrophus sp. SKADARSKE-3]